MKLITQILGITFHKTLKGPQQATRQAVKPDCQRLGKALGIKVAGWLPIDMIWIFRQFILTLKTWSSLSPSFKVYPPGHSPLRDGVDQEAEL